MFETLIHLPNSVTTVGGTTGYPEQAVTRFFSGGGFSNYVGHTQVTLDLLLTSLGDSSNVHHIRNRLSKASWQHFPKGHMTVSITSNLRVLP